MHGFSCSVKAAINIEENCFFLFQSVKQSTLLAAFFTETI